MQIFSINHKELLIKHQYQIEIIFSSPLKKTL